MANLIRRESRDVGRQGQSVSLDPFRMMEALLRWEPFRANESLLSRVGEFAPALDVKESKDAYHVKADLPGVAEKDIDISLTGNVLTISGKREEEHRQEGDQFFAMERSYGTFSRMLSLPEGADADRVTADLKDGVLTLNIPKRAEVQPKRISIGQGGGEAKAKA